MSDEAHGGKAIAAGPVPVHPEDRPARFAWMAATAASSSWRGFPPAVSRGRSPGDWGMFSTCSALTRPDSSTRSTATRTNSSPDWPIAKSTRAMTRSQPSRRRSRLRGERSMRAAIDETRPIRIDLAGNTPACCALCRWLEPCQGAFDYRCIGRPDQALDLLSAAQEDQRRPELDTE